MDTALDILIVDDEPLARNRLISLCKRIESLGEVNCASGGQEALDCIDGSLPDVLLLDVDMPDISGMDVANHCQSLRDVPDIIFTTAHRKYAVDAFRLDATDYLLKPVKEALLREALDRVRDRASRKRSGKPDESDQRIWVKDAHSSLQIRAVDIERIEAERDYMRLCLAGQSYLVHGSMRSFQETLPGDVFIRVHRSAMVRKNFIQEVRRKQRRHYVVMKDGAEVPVGPSYLDDVEKILPAYSGIRGRSETVTE